MSSLASKENMPLETPQSTISYAVNLGGDLLGECSAMTQLCGSQGLMSTVSCGQGRETGVYALAAHPV
jgi:hypothetical protein